MAKKPMCLVCQKEMLPGFIPDSAHGGVHLLRWCEGQPNPSFWTGAATRTQLQGAVHIVAYRCPECEALRLYAPSAPDNE